MHARLIAGLLAGTAVLAAGPGGVPAHATTAVTWTVSPGGTATATATAGTITLTDTRTGAVGTCASSKVTGTLKKGSGLSGQDIGTVTTAAFGTCAALGSVPLTVTTGLPWRISFTSYHPKTGVVAGTVSGIKVVLTGTFCDAVVNGTSGPADGVVSALYNDRIGQLTFLGSRREPAPSARQELSPAHQRRGSRGADRKLRHPPHPGHHQPVNRPGQW